MDAGLNKLRQRLLSFQSQVDQLSSEVDTMLKEMNTIMASLRTQSSVGNVAPWGNTHMVGGGNMLGHNLISSPPMPHASPYHDQRSTTMATTNDFGLSEDCNWKGMLQNLMVERGCPLPKYKVGHSRVLHTHHNYAPRSRIASR